MILFSLPFAVLHHVITYLYPLYASYKAIVASSSGGGTSTFSGVTAGTGDHQRTQQAELEGWLMYWSVVGAMSVVEGWAEWAWAWLPFYSMVKVAFTLWLVLPQTRGSTYLYTQYLGPFLQSHEDDIDVALESARQKASKAAGQWIARLWEQLRGAVFGAAAAAGTTAADGPPSSGPPPAGDAPTHPPPTMHDPFAGSASQVIGLVKRYGPLAAASVVSAMDRATAAAGTTATATATGREAPPPTASSSTRTTAQQRRAQLEAELAADDVGAERNSGQIHRRRGRRSHHTSDSDNDNDLAVPSSSSSADEILDHRTRAARTDLSGSYQLVDDSSSGGDDDLHNTQSAATPSRTAGGWTSWLRGAAVAGGATPRWTSTSTSPS